MFDEFAGEHERRGRLAAAAFRIRKKHQGHCVSPLA
jgi:hypothetical protein